MSSPDRHPHAERGGSFVSILALAAALAISLISIGCSSNPPRNAISKTEVRQAFEDWIAAYNRGRLESVRTHYDSNSVLLPEGRPTFHGWSDIEGYFAPNFEKFTYQLIPQIDRVEVSGNLGVVHGILDASATAIAGGSSHKARLRFLTVLQRNAEGRWHVLASMDNSPPR